VTFVLSLIGTVGGLVGVIHCAPDIPWYGWVLFGLAVYAAYLVVVGSFIAKRGLMLGRSALTGVGDPAPRSERFLHERLNAALPCARAPVAQWIEQRFLKSRRGVTDARSRHFCHFWYSRARQTEIPFARDPLRVVRR